jgi:hypothetical protein
MSKLCNATGNSSLQDISAELCGECMQGSLHLSLKKYKTASSAADDAHKLTVECSIPGCPFLCLHNQGQPAPACAVDCPAKLLYPACIIGACMQLSDACQVPTEVMQLLLGATVQLKQPSVPSACNACKSSSSY